MTVVMKSTVNIRINSEMNASFSFEHLVSDEEDARQLGKEDNRLFEAWIESFTKNE